MITDVWSFLAALLAVLLAALAAVLLSAAYVVRKYLSERRAARAEGRDLSGQAFLIDYEARLRGRR